MTPDIFNDVIGSGVDLIGQAIENKKGKGVRRLKAMVTAYREMAADAVEDGFVDDLEKEFLLRLQNEIVRQFAKLAS